MRASRSLLACLFVLTAGCGSNPVLGEWESDRTLSNGKKNDLDVFEDYTGEAKIYATPLSDPNAWVRFEFDVAWEDFGNGEYEFDLDCVEGPCDSDNFDMDCEVLEVENDDGEKLHKLDCEGDRKWADYPLQWERD